MVTLDNLNENVLNKIDLINKNMEMLIDKVNIFELLKNKDISDIDKNFIKNTTILQNQYNIILDKINIYEISSVLFITDYYTNINDDNTNNITQKKTQNIYNDNIFLLDNNNTNTLSNDYLFNLKEIYYSNFYQYKHYNVQLYNNKDLSKNISKNNIYKSSLKHLSKNIYNKFNIFLSTNDIYGSFDNFMEYLTNYVNYYQTLLTEYNEKYYNNMNLDKLFKKMIMNFNIYTKTKTIYNIDDINYDVCLCGNKMTIQSNTSELLCIKCGYVHTLIGSVFEDSQFFNQEGNRYKHGSYDPNRHCKFWIERIQAKENTIIDKSYIEKIEKCIKRDKIENIKNISVKQFRLYLKQTNLSKLNDHIPLIKKIITGYIPPQLNHNELHLLFNYFDKATKTYETIKPSSKKNSLYYPFLLYKLLEIIITDENKKNGLLNCIHLQSYETLIDNDKIWAEICKHNKEFVYKPTNKIDLY
jgi:hypothetical protein